MFPSRALTPEGVRLRDKPAKDTAVRGTMCSLGAGTSKNYLPVTVNSKGFCCLMVTQQHSALIHG